MPTMIDEAIEVVVTQAQEAVEQGNTVFLYALDLPASHSPILFAGACIEAIESVKGWRLDRMDVDGRTAYFLFRR